MVCTKFGWNWPSGSRYEDFKMWKVYDNDAADDDDDGQRTNFEQKTLLEPSAHVNYKPKQHPPPPNWTQKTYL